ncbi:MAG: hypothetical protein MHM6MM_005438 [Cercozoa sp. M6MM]
MVAIMKKTAVLMLGVGVPMFAVAPTEMTQRAGDVVFSLGMASHMGIAMKNVLADYLPKPIRFPLANASLYIFGGVGLMLAGYALQGKGPLALTKAVVKPYPQFITMTEEHH